MPKVPNKLYNHSERLVISHQISSSSGTTSSGRRHATYNATSIDVPVLAPDPGDEMDVDTDFVEHDHGIDDTGPHPDLQEEIPELPGLKVHAKQRAKRYENSVITYLLFHTCFTHDANRTSLSIPGRNTATDILMNVWFWRAGASFSKVVLVATRLSPSIDARIASTGRS